MERIIQWMKSIPSDVVSGVVSGLIVGGILLIINIWIEKRKDYYNYKNSFAVEDVNEVVKQIREVTRFFDEHIIQLGVIEECFQDKILNPIITQKDFECNNQERILIIDYYEKIDKWTTDAMTLINASRSFPKSRKVKKKIEQLKKSVSHISNMPIKDLEYTNKVLSEYFLDIVGNKKDNLDYDDQSKTEYNYSYLRNPIYEYHMDTSKKNKQMDIKRNTIHNEIYHNYDMKKKSVKKYLLDEDYYFRNFRAEMDLKQK